MKQPRVLVKHSAETGPGAAGSPLPGPLGAPLDGGSAPSPGFPGSGMEPAAYADAELINCFPSFSLPPPPVPKHGRSSFACRRGVTASVRGCSAAGRAVPDSSGAGGHKGCTPGLHSFPGRAGGRVPPPRAEHPRPGVSASLLRGLQDPFPGAQRPFPGAQHPFPGVQITPFPAQTAAPPAPVPPIHGTPLEHPHPRP